MSTASALSGEMYSTRQRCPLGGTGSNMIRLMHQRKAVSVLPLPVGARMSVDSPRAIAGQPRVCGGVGASNDAAEPFGDGRLETAREHRFAVPRIYFSGFR